jgi:hypothetical protein
MSKYKSLLLDVDQENEEITDFNFLDEDLNIKNKIDDDKIIYYNEDIENDENEDDEFYDIITDPSLIPEIKIEIESDEEDNKSVKFTLDIIINEEKNETISLDLSISKKTFLMIAEELFK